jgi:hypothetical protein
MWQYLDLEGNPDTPGVSTSLSEQIKEVGCMEFTEDEVNRLVAEEDQRYAQEIADALPDWVDKDPDMSFPPLRLPLRFVANESKGQL